MDNALRLFVQRITKLPTLPVIAQKILNLTEDDSTSVDMLENLIENDPPISAKILSVSNSAFFGSDFPVTTISGSIMRIGFNNVRNITLGIALMTVLENSRSHPPLDARNIFRHSVAVGMIAKLMADNLKVEKPEEVFTCGILHDLGLLVMNRYFADLYRKTIADFEKEKPLLDSEKETLGFTHANIGAWLADTWMLPEAVLLSIRYHHNPSQIQGRMRLVSLIHVADYLANRRYYRVTDRDPSYPLEPSSLTLLGISEKSLEELESAIDETMIPAGLFS
ncbi:MAG: HDOD domain-containing protein [Nitrospirae bacterium]|nr:HDOD domain-containing protein [Nitrospirota bacterium]